MYQIKCDGYILHDTTIENLQVINPKCELELNKTGSLTFSITPLHPYYDKINKHTSEITLYQDNNILFNGRVLNDDVDFNNIKFVECQGELSYLLDSIQRGKKYYEESRIEFLEKIDDRYFAIVNGTEKYLVIIKYTETDENKKMQVYCSCPCEFYCKHIYSVLLSIRNKEEKRFYKIMYKNPDKSLLERVMEFDYFLCLGVVEQNLEIINNYGEIELVPILDYKGRCNWTVLEDTEDEKLTKEIKYFLDNN